jgi:hypothetical protein
MSNLSKENKRQMKAVFKGMLFIFLCLSLLINLVTFAIKVAANGICLIRETCMYADVYSNFISSKSLGLFVFDEMISFIFSLILLPIIIKIVFDNDKNSNRYETFVDRHENEIATALVERSKLKVLEDLSNRYPKDIPERINDLNSRLNDLENVCIVNGLYNEQKDLKIKL